MIYSIIGKKLQLINIISFFSLFEKLIQLLTVLIFTVWVFSVKVLHSIV